MYNMEHLNLPQRAQAYLRRYPDQVKLSQSLITISTNKPQPVVAILSAVMVSLPAIAVWYYELFKWALGILIGATVLLLYIWQMYRFLRGHNQLVIHLKDRYVECKNVTFLWKWFFWNKRIAFDEIGNVTIHQKIEKNIEHRSLKTEWNQLTISTKANGKTIYMDFEKHNRMAHYVKEILDAIQAPSH